MPERDQATRSLYPAELPASFTTIEAEYQVLVAGCGLTLGVCPDRIELAGVDRERFLNGLLTCDIRGLSPGQGRFGFFTDLKGRILADVVLLALEDRFLLELPPGSAEHIVEHLEKYLIADRVEIGRPASAARLRFIGADCCGSLGDLLRAEPESELPRLAWCHAAVRLADREARICAVSAEAAGGAREWAVTLEGAAAPELVALTGATRVGWAALEARRVEAGRLLFGIDYGNEHFPQESGREEAVSYEKGCYLGQEIVARIHYRGGVNRVPRGLLFAAGDRPAAGTVLLFEGREVGRLTTLAHSVALDRPAGLGLIHRRAAEPGVRLEMEGGGEAEVAELPLLRSDV